MNVVFDGKHRAGASLKMQMIGRGRAAFRAVIDHKGVRQRLCKIEQRSELPRYSLQPMLHGTMATCFDFSKSA